MYIFFPFIEYCTLPPESLRLLLRVRPLFLTGTVQGLYPAAQSLQNVHLFCNCLIAALKRLRAFFFKSHQKRNLTGDQKAVGCRS